MIVSAYRADKQLKSRMQDTTVFVFITAAKQCHLFLNTKMSRIRP